MEYLISARPTAVNIADAAQKLKNFCETLKNESKNPIDFKIRYENF